MHLIESTQMAFSTLSSNKLRSGLTMLGIMIGTASVIGTIALGRGAQRLVAQEFESIGANQLYVTYSPVADEDSPAAARSRLSLSDAEAVQAQVPMVTAVAPLNEAPMTMTFQGKKEVVTVKATSPDFLKVQNMALARGQMFSAADQKQEASSVVIGAETAQKLFGSANPLGQEVTIRNVSFQVIGVLQPKGSFFGENLDQVAILPVTTFTGRLGGPKSAKGIPVRYIQVLAVDRESIRAAGFQIINVLSRVRGKKDVAVFANKSVEDAFGKLALGVSILLSLIAAIALIVGGIGIMNIMLVSVTERTQEIGLRKALGATQRDILTQFLIEAIIMAVIGGSIGITIGVTSMVPVGMFTPLKPQIPIGAIVIAVGVSGGIGLIFGVVPAKKAAQLDPIIALRSS